MNEVQAYIDEKISYWSEQKQYFIECSKQYYAATYQRQIDKCGHYIEAFEEMKRFIENK